MYQDPNQPQQPAPGQSPYRQPQPPYGQPASTYRHTSFEQPPPAYGQPQQWGQQVQAPTKRDKALLWAILGVIIAMAGVIIALFAWLHPFAPSTASSSVEMTLTTYCNALEKRDYQTAYDLGSSGNKRLFSESEWAAMISAEIAQQGGLVDCTVSNTSDDGSSGHGTITFLWGNKTGREVLYTLTNENGTWKIVGDRTVEIIHVSE